MAKGKILHEIVSAQSRTNFIFAWGETRRNSSSSVTICILPSMAYTEGVMLIISRIGEFSSKNLINLISCGRPEMSVIFTVLRHLNAQSKGHSFSQKSKLSTSGDTDVFEEPCKNQRG